MGAATKKLQSIVRGTFTPTGAKVSDKTVTSADALDAQASSSAQGSKAFIPQQ
jgi:hypothetical protein